MYVLLFFFFFKQKTAYEMRISDWSSDVCSSDLVGDHPDHRVDEVLARCTDRILDEEALVAEVHCGQQRGEHAHVRRDAGEHECVDAATSEQLVEVRAAEAAVAGFVEDQILQAPIRRVDQEIGSAHV